MNKSVAPLSVGIIEPVGGHGGMDYYDYGLCYGLAENNVTVEYFTCSKTAERHFKNVESFFTFGTVWSGSLAAKARKYILGYWKAFRILKKRSVTIIHLHFFFFRSIDFLVLLLAKTFRFTIVATIHDVNAFHKASNSIVESNCYKLISGLIVHNETSRKVLEKKGFLNKPYTIIPHGNYLPFITPINSSSANSNCFTVLFFGQIKQVKGLDLLLEAIAILVKQGYKNIRLIIKGKAYKNDLSKYTLLIKELGIVDYVEYEFQYIPDEEVAAVYSQADIVVLPYTEIYQSGVLLLTMSYGKPVLCSNLAAFKELIIDGHNGLLFEAGNSEDLANKIRFAMQHRDLLNEMARRANKMIQEELDWVKIGKQTKEFYRQVLSN
jgi:glycosyltransferase involved in cell wall biosynthesis